MDKIFERPVIIIALLFVMCGYLFFSSLGGMALTDPDETFYAQTAKEMLERNEWSTPYLYSKPQFEKPILFYWLVQASFRLFGVNEFASRLPSAVFALLGIFAIYLLGSLLYNRRTGALAAVILATNVEYIALSRACVTDMVLFTFMLFGVLFFFYGYLKERRHFYILSSISFALATLTKGPVAIFLPIAALVLYLLLARDVKAVKRMPLFWAAMAFLAVSLPWYVFMYRLHGRNFIDAFFGFHNVTRFLESEHKIGSEFYYNIPIMFGGFFPWSVFLPFGFWRFFGKGPLRAYRPVGPEAGARGQGSDKRKHCIFVLVWFFVIFGFFSISSTKLPTYIFPSFISLAIMVAVIWDDFLNQVAVGGQIKGFRISYFLLLAVALFATPATLIYINFDYPAIFNGVLVVSLFFIFGLALSFVSFINKQFVGTFFLIAYSVALPLCPIEKLILPELERYETSKVISQKLLSFMKPDEKLGSESNYLAGLAFYTGKVPIDVDKHNTLVKFLILKERVWCVLKEKNHMQLHTLDTKPHFMGITYLIYKIGKRAIVTNKVPDGGVYILKRERTE